ncbi:MAG: hypothetical protein HRU19_01565 [Pseudobacteriovorax sp.]|nr:hypothetical protein [Pseudobacteriovorax sp.]
MKLLANSLAIGLGLLFASGSSIAADKTSLEHGLNTMNLLSLSEDQVSLEDKCDIAVTYMNTYEGDFDQQSLFRWVESWHQNSCFEDRSLFSRNLDLEANADVAEAEVAEADDEEKVWNSAPYCDADKNTLLCDFNHKIGKGVFIYQRPDLPYPDRYLVCGLVNSASSGWLGSGQTTRSLCRKSEGHWKSWLKFESGPSRTFFKWYNTDFVGKPQKVPAALIDNCKNAFPQAKYCTPQLVIIPDNSPTSLNVCSLYTSRSTFNFFGIFQIGGGTSRWSCTTENLKQKVKPKNKIVDERRCLDHRGPSLPNNCALPWIPYTPY